MLLKESKPQTSSADDAIEALYRARATHALRLAFLMSGDLAVAEEIVQEGFVRTWQAWDRIDDTDAAYAYLRTTIVNLARSIFRRKMVELRLLSTRRDEGVGVHPDQDGRLDAVRAVATLPPRQRACVALRFFEDLTEAQTADVLGITVGAVKSQTSKALKRLSVTIGAHA